MHQTIFPKTYRYKRGALIANTLVSGLLTALFASPPLYLSERDAPYYWLFISLALLCAGAFGWMTVRVFFMKLILEETRLIYTGYLGTRIIDRAAIIKTLNLRGNFGFYTIDLAVQGQKRAPTITLFGPIDDALEKWFEGIPNAEYQAAVAVSDKLMANSAFGVSAEQRESQIGISANILNWMRWPTLAITCWGLGFPYPYVACLAILMVWPALALFAVALSGGRWTLNGFEGTHGAGAPLAIGPAMVLAIRAFQDNQVIDWWPSLLWAVPTALCLMLLVAAAERRLDISKAAMTAVIYFAYAWGSLSFLNVALDNQPAKRLQVNMVNPEAHHDR